MKATIVLAGGRSKRFGSNKAFIKLGDKPLLRHVVETSLRVVDEVVVAVGRDDGVAEYLKVLPRSVKVLKDTMESKSPLIGIITGMKGIRSEYTAVMSCDTPFVRAEVLKYLFGKAHGADAVVPRWPNGNIEPLHSIYEVSSTLYAAEEAVKMKRYRILHMINRLGTVFYVPINEVRKLDRELITFFNINTANDLRTAKAMMGTLQT